MGELKSDRINNKSNLPGIHPVQICPGEVRDQSMKHGDRLEQKPTAAHNTLYIFILTHHMIWH